MVAVPKAWPNPQGVTFINQLSYADPQLQTHHRLPSVWRPLVTKQQGERLHQRAARATSCPPTAHARATARLATELQRCRMVTNLPTCPNPTVAIRTIVDLTHPACGEYGLFATRPLTPGTLLLVYQGLVTHYDEADPQSDYVLGLDATEWFRLAHRLATVAHQPSTALVPLRLAIDAATMGNEARFINDYRGIAAQPNVEFTDFIHETTGTVNMGVWVRHHPIAAGQELLVNYGKSFWKSRQGDV
ncbi:hypothetical protein IWQ61_007220 [Dispira simplex]|nr:hypothetical protein IWQ61_007220 [Dispira simplex]